MASKPEETRSDKTRAALIEAGILLFGEHGFSATTTRMLAEEADANVAAIPYHFGSKEGLYHAVIGHIADNAAAMTAAARNAMEAGMSQNPSREDAITLIETLMASMAMSMIGEAEPRQWVQLIMREQAKPTKSFELLYEKMMLPLQRIFLQTFEAATDMPADSDEVKLRCHMLFGQLIIFLTSRETILRSLNVRELTPDHIIHIQQVLRAHVRACVTHAMEASA